MILLKEAEVVRVEVMKIVAVIKAVRMVCVAVLLEEEVLKDVTMDEVRDVMEVIAEVEGAVEGAVVQ